MVNMSNITISKPFNSFFISMIFIFSTMYGLYFYYIQGTSEQSKVDGLTEATSESFLGFINVILDIASWLSPFALVKFFVLNTTPTAMYQFLDLFFLRPIGWVGAMITANYIISRIPTVSSE